MPKGKKYTRAGVERAVKLAQCTDKSLWCKIEARYTEMLKAKGGDELVECDRYCRKDLKARMIQQKFITKDELLKIVQWKFLKGKPRHALMSLLKSNSESDVKDRTKSGMIFANDQNVDAAIDEIAKLRGVGPATASAILSIFKPSLFAFMDDEVIECLYDDGKRGYTTKIYRHMNDECTKLANQLNRIRNDDKNPNDKDEWNPSRVGRALWTAARLCATGLDDDDNDDNDDNNNNNNNNNTQDDSTTIKNSKKRAADNTHETKKRTWKRSKAK
jgi:hypothetical protein